MSPQSDITKIKCSTKDELPNPRIDAKLWTNSTIIKQSANAFPHKRTPGIRSNSGNG